MCAALLYLLKSIGALVFWLLWPGMPLQGLLLAQAPSQHQGQLVKQQPPRKRAGSSRPSKAAAVQAAALPELPAPALPYEQLDDAA